MDFPAVDHADTVAVDTAALAAAAAFAAAGDYTWADTAAPWMDIPALR